MILPDMREFNVHSRATSPSVPEGTGGPKSK